MTTPLLCAVLGAVFMFGLLIEALIFSARHDDPACTYRLFAVRDRLIRLSVEGKVARTNPYFDALYMNVTILLRCSRFISGPEGWPRASAIGRHLAHRPQDAIKPIRMPKEVPPSLSSVTDEIRDALTHMIGNHMGIVIQIDSSRREQAQMQRERAKALLADMPDRSCPA